VTLLTSHPETVSELQSDGSCWALHPYRTFDDLQALMADHVQHGGYEAIIHCAAVSDYLPAGVFATAPGEDTGAPMLVDRSASKIKSDQPELWLRLVRAPKLIDCIRKDWSFRGVLVKFKLEVGVTEEHLLKVAERSREESEADIMVANTLEGSQTWAFLGPLQNGYERISRADLPGRLIEAVERREKERRRG
jgi:phosphopantothenate-cysteine ligase/phosphopantothenoylcysteine decarboxylase/phosphopantothenate--cysteine ligase